MEVLVIGSDNPVGTALQGTFLQWGRHNAIPLSTPAARWRSERQAKKAARKNKPQAVLDLRFAWHVAAGEALQPLDVERAHWLAKACERSAIPYVLLSSDQAFAGQGLRSLREFDPPDAFTEPGLQVMEIEARVTRAAPTAVVLRTGPLFAGVDNNFLARLLEAMISERTSLLDHRNVFCPVACEDVARVLAAMLDQMSVGAQASGIYHYSSADRTTEYEFAQVALAALKQICDAQDVVITPGEENPENPVETRVLDCGRLRDSFAIKQISWRGFINSSVQQYFQHHTLQEVSD